MRECKKGYFIKEIIESLRPEKSGIERVIPTGRTAACGKTLRQKRFVTLKEIKEHLCGWTRGRVV